jgi:hypothetical protein
MIDSRKKKPNKLTEQFELNFLGGRLLDYDLLRDYLLRNSDNLLRNSDDLLRRSSSDLYQFRAELIVTIATIIPFTNIITKKHEIVYVPLIITISKSK